MSAEVLFRAPTGLAVRSAEAAGEQVNGRLLALAGHSNFIAGVIAKHCPAG